MKQQSNVQIEVTGVTQEVADRLRALVHQGNLTTEQVITDARNPSSPLHGQFEWDDSRAAHQYRLEQAANLIRRVKVKSWRQDGEITTVRAYVAKRDLPTTDPHEEVTGHYVPVESITDHTAEQSILEAIRRDLARLQVKYDSSAAFFRALRELQPADQ